MNKKIRNRIVLAVCAVLLACVSVSATLAYLTSTTGTVKNTFTVGKVSFLANGLDEALVNEYGEKVDKDGKTEAEVGEGWEAADRVTANTYKLIPGHTYTKDPTIHLDPESEDCYLFVAVHNGIAAIEANNTANISMQMQQKGWFTLKDGENNPVKITLDGVEYEVYFKGTRSDAINKVDCSERQDYIVFESFTVAADTVGGDKPETPVAGVKYLKDYEGEQVFVKAYAVQADGLESKTAFEIWNAAFGATK